MLFVALAGCGFQHGIFAASAIDAGGDDGPVIDDAPVDGAPDGAAATAFCPQGDPHLRLCFSFDQATLAATLPNEGGANVSAQLTNVTRIANGTGGAAQLGATSEIFVPYTTEVANIQAIEIWFRYDSEPTIDGGRMGLVDSNVVPPNISLFFYRQDPSHTLRCGIGSQTTVWNATLAPTTWFQLACVCENGSQKMYVNGVKVGDTAGACSGGGAFVDPDGFTIGSNNNGGPTGVNDQLLGAIDGIRLWDVPVTPAAPTL
ncbi:MAG TPA: LamG-like jellyroll fold domain-containing protein [Kofleriaceae bacterium]|nr:LamG-like jellyroll fold domain-containing protein [Kofleriaceae bacterium]